MQNYNDKIIRRGLIHPAELPCLRWTYYAALHRFPLNFRMKTLITNYFNFLNYSSACVGLCRNSSSKNSIQNSAFIVIKKLIYDPNFFIHDVYLFNLNGSNELIKKNKLELLLTSRSFIIS